MSNPIEALASRLQSLPSSIRWLYAQQEVVQATALGTAPQRGTWSRAADRLVLLSSQVGLARSLAAITNFCLLLVIYIRQNLVCHVPSNSAILVGIGALREADLVLQFEAMRRARVLHLFETELTHFFRHGHVPLLALLREMRSVWRETWEHLSPLQPSQGVDKVYLLSFLLMRGHRYAHLRAWCRQYMRRSDTVPVIAWTTASYLAYAPIAVGIETIYMEHGFQRHGLIYPDYAQGVCFNGFDAEHLHRRLPQCAVKIAARPAHHFETRRAVAVAGIFWAPDGFDLIRPFIDWALRNDLPVFVRKHPVDVSDYWEQWRGVAGIEIAAGEGSFAEFLDRIRPRLLASWFSTALYDALVEGIVPVTVTPKSHEAALDTVFPFRDLSLCWPEHEEVAWKLIDDDQRRAEFLADSYARAMTVPQSVMPVEFKLSSQL